MGKYVLAFYWLPPPEVAFLCQRVFIEKKMKENVLLLKENKSSSFIYNVMLMIS